MHRCPGCGDPPALCDCKPPEPEEWREHDEPHPYVEGSEKIVENQDVVGGV